MAERGEMPRSKVAEYERATKGDIPERVGAKGSGGRSREELMEKRAMKKRAKRKAAKKLEKARMKQRNQSAQASAASPQEASAES